MQKIRSRCQLIADIINRDSELGVFGLQELENKEISLDTPCVYNIANTDHIKETIARTLAGLRKNCGVQNKTLCDFFLNLTSEQTAEGYLSQFQGYEWLLNQQTTFAIEVNHSKTLRRRNINLDGRIDMLNRPVFFDIKSHSFGPSMRDKLRRRLESRLPDTTISIDGPDDHNAASVQHHAFRNLGRLVEELQNAGRSEIAELDWHVRVHRGPRVVSSVHEFSAEQFIENNKWWPLKHASQFTTDAPYVLFSVLPDGFGSSAIIRNIFNVTEQMFAGIARHLFSDSIMNTSDVRCFDKDMSGNVTVSQAVARLSGIAVYSRQASLAAIHLNKQAASRLSRADAQRIACGWSIFEY